MMAKQPIGFIGLGSMGRGIARNLVNAGYPLTVLAGPRRSGVADLVVAGAREAVSAAELARACDVIFTCLPSSQHVAALVHGEHGFLAAARPGFVHVDLTSGDPAVTLQLVQAYAGHGFRFADIAMSGMPEQAAAAELTLMVGADAALLHDLADLLACIAKKVILVGGAGAGHRTKLIIGSIGMAMASATAEALMAARASGIDLQVIHDLITDSGMNSATFQTMSLAAMTGDVGGRKLTIGNARKDLAYFVQMLDAAGLNTMMAPATLRALSAAAEAGHAGEFVPALTQILCAGNGIALRGGAVDTQRPPAQSPNRISP